jgi:dTMP kinase
VRRPLFVVFEGIDGSGKTTLSGAVARVLRGEGLRVEHVREGGRFASPSVQRIRELGRDARNALLCDEAELLLFLARDVQLLEEAILPALERADVVVADRYFYTADVLARVGRGLPEGRVAPLVAAFAARREPDLVVLVDADPHVALARRRVRKVLHPDPKPPSRKGLGGAGLQHRLRRGYLELAARDPARWRVLRNDAEPLARAEADALALVRSALAGRPPPPRERSAPRAHERPALASPEDAREAFFAWIDRCAAREPCVAAYFLSGTHGPGFDGRRLALAETEAAPVIAWGLRGLADPVSWALRRRLVERLPALVASSLVRVVGAEAWRMRRALAAAEGGAVAESLEGDDEEAWSLREGLRERHPLEVVASLGGLDADRAWAAREAWLAAAGGLEALCDPAPARAAARSVRGLGSERAWEIRLAALAGSPPDALASLAGLHDARAWDLRERYASRAGKSVFKALEGVDHPRAWRLRDAAAPLCKEAVDSITGLDAPPAWRLRHAVADEWPSTVVKSLGALAVSPPGRELAARLLARHPDHPSLLKHAAMLFPPPPAARAAGRGPPWI